MKVTPWWYKYIFIYICIITQFTPRTLLTENELRVHLNDHVIGSCKPNMPGNGGNIHGRSRNNLHSFHPEEITFRDTILNVNNVLCIKRNNLQFKKLYICTRFLHREWWVLKQTCFFGLTDLFSFNQRLKFFHIMVTCNRQGMIQRSDTCEQFHYLLYVFPCISFLHIRAPDAISVNCIR